MRHSFVFTVAVRLARHAATVLLLLAAANANATCNPNKTTEQSYCLLSELGGCDKPVPFLASKLAPSTINGIIPLR